MKKGLPRVRVTSSASDTSIPTDSTLFAYGAMLPFLAAAAGSWAMPTPWSRFATTLAIIWGALILAFVGGVRRGFGFGDPRASKTREFIAAISFFVPAGLALIAETEGLFTTALALLIAGFWLVIILDRYGALAGDAPAYFARLKPSQMTLAIVSLGLLLAHQMRGG